MEIKNIMVPTDGSENAELAIEMAIGIAGAMGAKITAVNVIDKVAVMNLPAQSAAEPILEALNREAEKAVAKVVQTCHKTNIEAYSKILAGSPAETLVDESSGYDLIVMSSLGRTGINRFLIGSVAEKVVRSAKCPVMVVHSRKN